MEFTAKACLFFMNLILLEVKYLFPNENLNLCKLHKGEANKEINISQNFRILEMSQET